MSNEELVNLIQGGIDVKQNLWKLYNQNIGVIRLIARRYTNGNNFEDLLQEAFFGIKRAAEMWSSEVGVPFLNYADQWISGYISRYAKSDDNIRIPSMDASTQYELRKKYNTFSLDSVLYRDKDGNPVTLEDVVQDPCDPIEEVTTEIESKELKAKLWELVDDLPERESQILHNVYEHGKTLDQCSKEMNVSGERCRQIKNKALHTMRDPGHQKALSPYMIDSIESYAFHRSGITDFKYTNTSCVEKAVIRLFDK